MLEKMTRALQASRLRRKMKDPTFAGDYANRASDDDWRFLVPGVTDAQLAAFHALQKAVSPTKRFSEMVTALETCCPPEDEDCAVAGSISPIHRHALGRMYCVTLCMTYPKRVNVGMTLLYEMKDAVNSHTDDFASEHFDPEVYDELRTTYAALDQVCPTMAYAWVERDE